MKHLKIFFLSMIIISMTSFIAAKDYSKFILGKWELVKIITPEKKEIDVRKFIGESYMEFKADKTYQETGTDSTNGTWQIVEGKYLQTKKASQTLFTEKMEIKEISANEAQLTTPNKSVMYMKRVLSK